VIEADRALAEVHALVELLRDAHGALRAEAELARGLLLQVEVVKGGEGLRLRCFLSTFATVSVPAALLERAANLGRRARRR